MRMIIQPGQPCAATLKCVISLEKYKLLRLILKVENGNNQSLRLVKKKKKRQEIPLNRISPTPLRKISKIFKKQAMYIQGKEHIKILKIPCFFFKKSSTIVEKPYKIQK